MYAIFYLPKYATFEEIVHTLDNFGKIKIKSINIVFYRTIHMNISGSEAEKLFLYNTSTVSFYNSSIFS